MIDRRELGAIFLDAGLLGSYTTFSTWMVETRRAALTLGRFVADHRVVIYFPHPPFVDEQVGVAYHLGEGEEGLGDGDVAPERLGDLVAAAGALGDQAVDLLLAAVVAVHPRVDQLGVVGD